MDETGVKSCIIPVAFSTNDNYAPYLDVAMRSLIDHAGSDNDYAVYILYTHLSARNIRRIEALRKGNIHIEFIDVTEELRELDYSPDGHVSVETVYRMVIPDVLPQYEKIIYLDCDLIVLQDIAQLYAQDIGDSILGATREIAFDWLVEHARNTLKIEPSDVFNAGVLIINSRKFKEQIIKRKCFDLLAGDTYFRVWDQDVLNIVCRNSVRFIDRRWNCGWGNAALNARSNSFAGSRTLDEIEADACIIHYHTYLKPWFRPDIDLAEYFWKYARESTFYEEILFRNFNRNIFNCFEKYLFPFNAIEKGANIALYGAGRVGEAFFQQLKATCYANVLMWCDKNYRNMRGEEKISDPLMIHNIPYDYVLIAVKNEKTAEEIKDELIAIGIDENKIVWISPQK